MMTSSIKLWLDVRSQGEFVASRLASITPGHGLCVPLETLHDRWFELPPAIEMGEWMWIVRDTSQREELLEAVALRWDHAPPPCPVNIMVWDEEKDKLALEGAVTSGPFPFVPLWHPSPALASSIDTVEASLASQGIPKPWIVVDLGCGSGRDAAFLASRGCWKVVLVDQSPSLLDKAADLCRRYGKLPPSIVTTDSVSSSETELRYEPVVIQADLTKQSQIDSTWSTIGAGAVHFLHVARFLHKPMLPYLPTLVAPGGWVVYMAFADGAQFVGKCTPKNPKHLVYPGELAAVFGESQGFVCPPHRDATIPIEDGWPACDFVVQKSVEAHSKPVSEVVVTTVSSETEDGKREEIAE